MSKFMELYFGAAAKSVQTSDIHEMDVEIQPWRFEDRCTYIEWREYGEFNEKVAGETLEYRTRTKHMKEAWV